MLTGGAEMILTKYVMYRGKKKLVSELSPTCGYKVDVKCPVCGKVRNVFYSSIARAGHTICQSCIVKMKQSKHLEVGSKFNRLTVLRPSERSGYSICKCDCGNVVEVLNRQLTSGRTKSCGCLQKEKASRNLLNNVKKGEEHHNWKGGKSSETNRIRSQKRFKEWKETLLSKAGYKCEKCGSPKDLHVHHILPIKLYPEKILDLDNGVVLCSHCHRRFHHLYGRDATKEEFEKFMIE